tara:strand:+ start:4510 stop:4758 length:249 start_codon:yes stop_codon:yes gene_type:complete
MNYETENGNIYHVKPGIYSEYYWEADECDGDGNTAYGRAATVDDCEYAIDEHERKVIEAAQNDDDSEYGDWLYEQRKDEGID